MKKRFSIHLIIWPCILGTFISQSNTQLGGALILFGVGMIYYGIYVHFHNKKKLMKRKEFLNTANR